MLRKVIFGFIIVITLAVALAAASFLYVFTPGSSAPKNVNVPNMSGANIDPVNTNDSQVKLGEYLARAGDCIACHTNHGSAPYSGNYPLPTPFGTIYSPNLTPDKETGLGKWTADDFWRAMHDGRRQDGSFLYPAFPYNYYTKMSREETDAIFAYLQSLPAIHNPPKENEMPFPFNQRFILLGWRILFFKKGEFIPDPSKSAEYNRGAYLVQGPAHCGMCHTPINPLGGSVLSAKYAGGLIPIQNWYAPAIHNNKEFGLGNWPKEDIAALLKTGVSNSGVVYGPMGDVVYNSTQFLKDKDLNAIATYLKEQPELKAAPEAKQVQVTKKFAQQLTVQGRNLYSQNCAVCHGANGQGQVPHYPPLVSNASMLMDSPANPIKMILHGGFPPVTKGNPEPYGMPPFAHLLTDEEIAAIATYIRSAWGNKAMPVSPAEVNKLRAIPMH